MVCPKLLSNINIRYVYFATHFELLTIFVWACCANQGFFTLHVMRVDFVWFGLIVVSFTEFVKFGVSIEQFWVSICVIVVHLSSTTIIARTVI